MKDINRYYEGYQESNNHMDYLKYELLNEFGMNNRKRKEYYNEEKIIKTRCDHRG